MAHSPSNPFYERPTVPRVSKSAQEELDTSWTRLNSCQSYPLYHQLSASESPVKIGLAIAVQISGLIQAYIDIISYYAQCLSTSA
ncbi:hypothetical protein B5X24_HaOG210872 [Helicoverpa armigera]|uniref:Uncharacterized protein n=1 Tax=Helicoverpa armigera TaxID=29058 RepID=A0A2W1BCD6_HELAM|nr:hypothetical protein B5X24_HaOG210872 [Helicoverpa armigera]